MSENEKLRKLLAEAREALVRAENRMIHPPHQVPDAIKQIDAALAEPVIDSTAVRLQRVRESLMKAIPADGTIGNADDVSRVNRLVEERDKAIADNERLREALASWEATWYLCHDGSEDACCKAHE